MWSKYNFGLLACTALAIVGRSDALPQPIADGDARAVLDDVSGNRDTRTLPEIADIDEAASRKKRDITDIFSYFFSDEDYYEDYFEQTYIICKNCTIVQEQADTTASTTTQETIVVPPTTTSTPQIVETTTAGTTTTGLATMTTAPTLSTEAVP